MLSVSIFGEAKIENYEEQGTLEDHHSGGSVHPHGSIDCTRYHLMYERYDVRCKKGRLRKSDVSPLSLVTSLTISEMMKIFFDPQLIPKYSKNLSGQKFMMSSSGKSVSANKGRRRS